MHALTTICSLGLTIYLIWEAARSTGVYRKLEQAVSSGDTRARTTFYYSVYWVQGISATLAFAALGFDWSRFNARSFGLVVANLGVIADLPPFAIAIFIGTVVIGSAAILIVLNARSKNSGASPMPALGDYSALIPATPRERGLAVLVALSAGVCEEIVFRGWLLNSLHGWFGFKGWPLMLTAAVLFGAAHWYQGVAGVVATACGGLLFCLIYAFTGTLLVPMIIHFVTDLKLAFLPAVPASSPQQHA